MQCITSDDGVNAYRIGANTVPQGGTVVRMVKGKSLAPLVVLVVAVIILEGKDSVGRIR